jgi:formate dehydrogenase subunit gamma
MSRSIQRYTERERMNHWVMAILFFLAALSGLAFFHPSMYWLTNLFGGGAWTRILHPFLGVLMFLSFIGLMTKLWHHNKITDDDKKWLAAVSENITGQEQGLQDVGRYNGGQKVLFWVTVVCTFLLLITGVMFWQPWFADSFPIGLRRIAALLHALSATVLIVGTIVHIYAAIWIKGSIRAMSRGTVSEAWARKHHPAWYREMTRNS